MFFQRGTDFPCKLVVDDPEVERLHRRVTHSSLSSSSVTRKGLGITKVWYRDYIRSEIKICWNFALCHPTCNEFEEIVPILHKIGFIPIHIWFWLFMLKSLILYIVHCACYFVHLMQWHKENLNQTLWLPSISTLCHSPSDQHSIYWGILQVGL